MAPHASAAQKQLPGNANLLLHALARKQDGEKVNGVSPNSKMIIASRSQGQVYILRVSAPMASLSEIHLITQYFFRVLLRLLMQRQKPQLFFKLRTITAVNLTKAVQTQYAQPTYLKSHGPVYILRVSAPMASLSEIHLRTPVLKAPLRLNKLEGNPQTPINPRYINRTNPELKAIQQALMDHPASRKETRTCNFKRSHNLVIRRTHAKPPHTLHEFSTKSHPNPTQRHVNCRLKGTTRQTKLNSQMP
ncbi:MAG: hypothetical protein EZS28_006845 [Streblomastix strix]|uniref:Uncharacterized protein n=1 Tax=Streblomastix strix TaxID=222440 RepID=A0A5J4WRS8_9EUKA|nr:MAG: hypothetical protein EZS28_006845 [Streblomastix strix]